MKLLLPFRNFCLTLIVLSCALAAHSQNYCPVNINFEQGNLNGWSFATAINGGALGLRGLRAATPIAGRHTITSGTTTDYYGNFPVVDPVGGTYSLKIGNDNVGAEVDRASYTFTVPQINNYSLIYRYAVVFENPAHVATEQPSFKVRVYDSATGAIINCASFTYVSAGGLPGFSVSSKTGVYGGSIVYYKPWATASLNLSGQAGKTLVIEFTSADCSLGAHMGYGYVDVSCGLFAISSSTCNATSPLTAPPGFQSYTWYNANYSAVVGTGQSITVPTPNVKTKYNVVLTPYTGYGCPDTLTTEIFGSTLSVNAGADTMVCNAASVSLNPAVVGNAGPFTYSWTPNNSLSCSSCKNPAASPAATTDYVVTVTDTLGCTKRDTVQVKPAPEVTAGATPAACYGAANGSLRASASKGTAPYTYSWNTTPASATANPTNIAAGSYTVTATDAKGCQATAQATVTQPSRLTASVLTADSVSCNGSADGRATATATGGSAPYTYSWNTTPAKTGATATLLAAGTYTVTVTDSTGCTDTKTVTIAQPAALSMSLQKVRPACAGTSTGSVSVIAAGGTAPYSYAIGNGAFSTTNSFGNLAAGTYTIHLRDAKSCVLDSIITIGQPAPVALSWNLTQPLCNGSATGQINMSATGGTAPYQYAVNTGNYSATAQAGNLAAGTYVLHGRDAAGCQSDSSVTLSQPQALRLSLNTTAATCNGTATGLAQASATGGTAPYQYAINTGAYGSSAQFSALAAGTYTLHLRDAAGCTQDSTFTITQPAALAMNFTTTAPACSGTSSGQILVAAAGGSPSYQYAIGTGAFGSNPAFSNLAAGAHIVHLRDGSGCTLDSTVQLQQPGSLNATANTTAVSCFGGANGAVQISVNGGTAPYSYSWNGISATGATAGNLTAGTYTATVTDSKGCIVSLSATVAQAAAITATVNTTAPACNGGNTGSAAAVVSGGTAPYSYSWTGLTQNAAAVNALASGNYTLTVTDAASCSASFPLTIPATAPVQLRVSAINPSCFDGNDGKALALISNAAGPYTYTWQGLPSQQRDTAHGLAAGTYTVTVTTAAGCTATGSVTLSNPQRIDITVTSQGTCNSSAMGSLTAVATGGTAPYQYQWNTVPSLPSATASGLSAGLYRVRVTDHLGCKDSTTGIVPAQSGISIEATASRDTVCKGGQVQLSVTGASSYSWAPSSLLSCADCATPFASPLKDTLFTVVGRDSNGCRDTAFIRVAVMQRTPVRVAEDVKVCQGGTATLQSFGGISRIWLTDKKETESMIVVTPQATTSYAVAITENSCFTDTLYQHVEVLATPTVEAGDDMEAAIGSEVTLHARMENASRITWIPSQGLSCAECADPVHRVAGKAIYVAKVSNELGCFATDTVRISDVCDEKFYFFANMFSPNADGNNDRFYPQGPGNSRIDHFMVYDRWGEVVFSARNISVNDPAAGWDGTFRNQQLKADVYVYVMDAVCENGKKIVVRGDVTLVR